MFTFTDDEVAYLRDMRAITTDAQGRWHLVGLTLKETEFYWSYARRRVRDEGAPSDDGDRYLELHDKHERARFRVLGAEIVARNEKPVRH